MTKAHKIDSRPILSSLVQSMRSSKRAFCFIPGSGIQVWKTLWLKYSISGTDIRGDIVAGEKENSLILLPPICGGFHWQLYFWCVHTTLSQLKGFMHTSLENHIISKPLLICEKFLKGWNCFLFQLEIMGVFSSVHRCSRGII